MKRITTNLSLPTQQYCVQRKFLAKGEQQINKQNRVTSICWSRISCKVGTYRLLIERESFVTNVK